MDREYDFFGMGVRHATEGLLHLKKVAKEIGEKYGMDAKLEFESGIATTIPTYAQVMQNEINVDLKPYNKAETENYQKGPRPR